jgi:hypothetical protein
MCKPHFPGSRLYYIESNDFDESAQVLSTITPVDYTLMHQRFTHPSQKVLKHAVKHTKDFPRISFPQNGVEHICKGCTMGKMANRSYPPKTEHATHPFEIVHSDLWSAPIQGYCGNKYVMTFLDDFSSHAWSICMKKKSEAPKVLKQFITLTEACYCGRIAKFKCDQGGKYMLDEFKNILANAGIELIPSPPRTLGHK